MANVIGSLAVALTVGLAVVVPEAIAQTGAGQIRKFDGVDTPAAECITSTDFVAMTGMSVEFRLPGTAPAKVVAMFTAVFGQGSGLSTGWSEIRLLIDDVPQSFNVDGQQGSTVTLGGFNFISDTLAAGPHRAVIQWRSMFGDLVCVDERSLVVLHR